MNTSAVVSLVRHVLTTLGGMLIARGVLDEGQMNEIIGGVSVLVGVVWGFINSRKKTLQPKPTIETEGKPEA